MLHFFCPVLWASDHATVSKARHANALYQILGDQPKLVEPRNGT